MLLVAPKSPFLFKCLTKAVLSQLDVTEHCQCHDNMWSVGGLPVLPGICLFTNLDSQRNFPYLEASDRDLILAELDWNMQFPTKTSNFFQVWLSLVLLEKAEAFWAVAEHRAHTVFVFLLSFLQSHIFLMAALDLVGSQAFTGCSVAPVAEVWVYVIQPPPKWHSEISCRKEVVCPSSPRGGFSALLKWSA